jgi:hypothetical protein
MDFETRTYRILKTAIINCDTMGYYELTDDGSTLVTVESNKRRKSH